MALFRELPVSSGPARGLVHRTVSQAAMCACQAVSSAWRTVPPACPATLSVCRAALWAALSAFQAMSSAGLAVLSVALSVCQVAPLAWRTILSDCPATLSIRRAVLSVALSVCQSVASAWRAVPSPCQAAPLFSLSSPGPPLENWPVLQEKPMRVRPRANAISISSNSLQIVSTSQHLRLRVARYFCQVDLLVLLKIQNPET